MSQEGKTFIIKRMLPEDAQILRLSWLRPKKPIQRSYKITNDEQRYQFLCKVLNKELTVSEAAVKFEMNYTTAKNVLNLYLNENRIEKKKHRIRNETGKKHRIRNKTSKVVPKGELKIETQQNSNLDENSLKQKGKLSADFWINQITEHMK